MITFDSRQEEQGGVYTRCSYPVADVVTIVAIVSKMLLVRSNKGLEGGVQESGKAPFLGLWWDPSD